MWGERAKARCTVWEPTSRGGKVGGEHDGYARPADPVVHRRTLELDGPGRHLIVRDEILARGRHGVELYLHLAEDCRARQVSVNRFEVAVGPGSVTVELDPRLSVRVLTGSEDPIGGWVSRGYHRKAPGTTLIGRCTADGAAALVSRIAIARA
jgi:hypothetical protein